MIFIKFMICKHQKIRISKTENKVKTLKTSKSRKIYNPEKDILNENLN